MLSPYDFFHEVEDEDAAAKQEVGFFTNESYSLQGEERSDDT